ncbi:hypothetical protein BDZ89DRAFT_1044164 [Hymenopellis radicata]|nr:hypothetical protein BDZ89DRAFT_1044164 [Hymenopellis radicata]
MDRHVRPTNGQPKMNDSGENGFPAAMRRRTTPLSEYASRREAMIWESGWMASRTHPAYMAYSCICNLSGLCARFRTAVTDGAPTTTRMLPPHHNPYNPVTTTTTSVASLSPTYSFLPFLSHPPLPCGGAASSMMLHRREACSQGTKKIRYANPSRRPVMTGYYQSVTGLTVYQLDRSLTGLKTAVMGRLRSDRGYGHRLGQKKISPAGRGQRSRLTVCGVAWRARDPGNRERRCQRGARHR